MPFKPGKSGNPGGRPKSLADIVSLARDHSKEATERLAFWMRSDNARASVAAAQALLDRGWGKAPQFVTGDSEEFEKIMGDDELRAAILECVADDPALASHLGLAAKPNGKAH